MEKTFNKLESILLIIIVFLFPITVLPISPNPFVVPKLAVLSFGIALLILIKTVRVIISGKLELRVGKYDLPVALIGIAYTVSAILRTPNKMEAFLLPGTATIALSSVLLYFLINQLADMDKKRVLTTLLLSSSVFAVFEFLAFTKILAKIPQLPAAMKAESFTPEGGFLPAALFLACMLPIGIGNFTTAKNAVKKISFAITSSTIFFGLIISVYNLLPGKPYAANFPGYATDWSIAVDALKESPVLGIGPGNYLTAFNRFRPLSFNNTKLWAVKFTTARSFYLTLLTETGMLGASGVILLLLALYRNISAETQKGLSSESRDTLYSKTVWGLKISPGKLSLIVILISLAFFPATLLIFAVLFITLSSVTETKLTTLNLKTQGGDNSETISRFPALLISIPIIIIVSLFLYRASRALAAEYAFNKAILALSENKAQTTYSEMINAIKLNPGVDRYRLIDSQINLILANSIAQKQKDEITEQDRVNITQLIQQAIAEAKAAVALNPLRSGNWVVLGNTYQTIIPLAQGSDVFAIQTYQQAVALDPYNPNTRITLGGVYYSRENYENAIKVFDLAVLTKNDHANAHYNLAFAYRDAGQIDKAVNEMTIVLSLINRTTGDYEIARKALEDMQEKKKAIQTPTAGTELTPPQEAQEPILKPPLDLPEGSEPPEAPITPTPTPKPDEIEGSSSPIPSPQVTPTPQP